MRPCINQGSNSSSLAEGLSSGSHRNILCKKRRKSSFSWPSSLISRCSRLDVEIGAASFQLPGVKSRVINVAILNRVSVLTILIPKLKASFAPVKKPARRATEDCLHLGEMNSVTQLTCRISSLEKMMRFKEIPDLGFYQIWRKDCEEGHLTTIPTLQMSTL